MFPRLLCFTWLSVVSWVTCSVQLVLEQHVCSRNASCLLLNIVSEWFFGMTICSNGKSSPVVIFFFLLLANCILAYPSSSSLKPFLCFYKAFAMSPLFRHLLKTLIRWSPPSCFSLLPHLESLCCSFRVFVLRPIILISS